MRKIARQAGALLFRGDAETALLDLANDYLVRVLARTANIACYSGHQTVSRDIIKAALRSQGSETIG
jgi:histone H3/H4